MNKQHSSKKKVILGSVVLLFAMCLSGTIFAIGASTPSISGSKAALLQSAIDAAAKTEAKTLVLKGDFYLTKPIKLTDAHNGLKLDGKQKARLIAGQKLAGWKKVGKVLQTKVNLPDVEIIYVNGERAQCAQSKEFYYMHSAYTGTTNPDGSPREIPERNVFIARNVDLADLDGLSKAEIDEAYIDIFRNWYNFKAKIEAIVKNPDGQTSTVFLYEKMNRPFIRKGVKTPPRFKFGNIKKCLDQEGEFYFDKKTKVLSYVPRKGETAENISVLVPTLDHALEICGTSPTQTANNITIDGINFECGGFFPADDWRPAVQAASSTDGFVRVQNARNAKITNCKISNVNTYGICLKASSQNIEVSANTLLDCGSGGISITSNPKLSHTPGARPGFKTPKEKLTSDIKVYNNIIGGYGRWNKGGIGIVVFDCGNIILDHNTIFDGYYSGISSGWSWGFNRTHVENNRYTNNKIFNIGYNMLCDMGGIYTLGRSHGSVISGNDISNVQRHRYGGWGIYNDEGSTGWVIENNYVHDTQEDAYFLHYGKHNLIRNNIFYNAEISQLAVGPSTMYADPSKVDEPLPNGKPRRLGDIKLERNIVIAGKDSRIMKNQNSIKRENVKSEVFIKNLYWHAGKEVRFSKYSFQEWKEIFKQDKDSVIADPKWNPKTLKFESDVYKKIGFKPFDISKAGVVGEMKLKFDNLMKTYKFPPSSKIPAIPPWRTDKTQDGFHMQQ